MSGRRGKLNSASSEDNSSDDQDSGRISDLGLDRIQSVRRVARRQFQGVAEAWQDGKEGTQTPRPHAATYHPGGRPRRTSQEEESKEEEEDEWDWNQEEEALSRSINDWIDPQKLVQSLARMPNFRATHHKLWQQHGHSHDALVRFVIAYKKTFNLNNDVVELRPQLKLCQEHSNGNGCQASHCVNLHVCPKFVERICDNDRCGLGHEWSTDHNQPVLQDYYLDTLDSKVLHNLIDCTLSSEFLLEPLDICCSYIDNRSCEKKKCNSLHVCKTFVMNMANCEDNECSFNHTFTDPMTQRLLIIHGIPANEAPLDIVKALIDSNHLIPIEPPVPDPEEEPYTIPEADGNPSSTSSDSESDSDPSNVSQWSHGVDGNVMNPGICEHSVVGLCPDEDIGCSLLHADKHYHWQVSQYEINWLNLRPPQVDSLERAFIDPHQKGEAMPYLRPGAEEPCWASLFELLGSSVWSSDFTKMQLVSGECILNLRRLHTTGECSLWAASTFLWYRECSNDQWMEYGQDNGEDFVIRISSEEIEKKYEEKSYQTIVYTGNIDNYSINFETMIETNLNTQNQRRVRRRPKPHLREDATLPPGPWTLQDVPTFDRQYGNLILQLGDAASRYSSITIKKIDNSLFRRTFHGRVGELQKENGLVEVQQLFQAIDPTLLSVVCAENFNWWHQGKRSSLTYGRGCYFYPDACRALDKSPNSNAKHRLVVFRVLIGTLVKGDVMMVKPPFNPDTCTRYDSTTNNPDNPSVIVKYHSNEYYPEYIIILK